jgi:hypothetical protein
VILFLRIFIVVLLGAVLGIAVVPLFVLMNLNDGGDGWGLCPDGLESCRTSYFDGFELLAMLAVLLLLLVGLIAVCFRLIRYIEGSPGRPLFGVIPRLPR